MNCKNFDEIEKALGGYGITMTSKVKQLHFESVQNAVSGIVECIKIFPQLKGQIIRFDTHYYNNWIMSSSYNGTIYFNLNRFNKLFPMKEEKINKKSNGKWHHPVHTGFSGTGAHEAGHLLIKAEIEQLFPDKSLEYRMHLWANSSVAQDILDKVAKQNHVNLYNLQKEMCTYARTNASECVAEGICDYIVNGDKAQRLSIMLANYFKR